MGGARFVVGIDEVGRAATKRASLAQRYVIGIDEVGRGSLAGPVVVAAAAVPKNSGFRIKNFGKLRDSKKLTAKRRGQWFKYFRVNPEIDYAVARVYPRQIEKRNISAAANLAASRAYARLISGRGAQRTKHKVFLDGGLFLGNGDQPKNARTIIKGDEKITAIKIASIIAKVSRDRGMERLGKIYPRYGFEIHKGYGTKAHIQAIKKFGPSVAHRLTFIN